MVMRGGFVGCIKNAGASCDGKICFGISPSPSIPTPLPHVVPLGPHKAQSCDLLTQSADPTTVLGIIGTTVVRNIHQSNEE